MWRECVGWVCLCRSVGVSVSGMGVFVCVGGGRGIVSAMGVCVGVWRECVSGMSVFV